MGSPSRGLFRPWFDQAINSDGALEIAALEFEYMALSSTPFGGLCLQLRSLCSNDAICGNALMCGTRTSGATPGPVLTPAPPSPEGDHFLQTPDVETCVVLPQQAPIPSRRNALRCIRDGTGRMMA
jgi:hypothetical protein